MAAIRLTYDEISAGLPPVCMCCGAAAEYRIPKTLLLQELDLGRGPQMATVALIRAIQGLSNAPRIRSQTSFCEAHRHYWRNRFALLFGGLAGLFVLTVFGLAIVVAMITIAKSESHWPEGLVFLSLVTYLVAWIVTSQRVMSKSIRVRGSLDGIIEIQNVAEAYVARCEVYRKSVKPPRAGERVELTSAVVAERLPVAVRLTDRPERVPSKTSRDSDQSSPSGGPNGSRPTVLAWLLLGLAIGIPVLGSVVIVRTAFSRKQTPDGPTANAAKPVPPHAWTPSRMTDRALICPISTRSIRR
jgi:hypothetical protein